MQYVPIARLSWIGTAPVSYIVHGLQPADDRIAVDDLSEAENEDFVRQWAGLVASAHLRSGGWMGSVDLDELIDFGRSLDGGAQRRLLSAARDAAADLRRAWSEFRK
jgi:hypothetical protein